MSRLICLFLIILWFTFVTKVIAATTQNYTNLAQIIAPTSTIKATIFPLQIQHGIKLFYNNTNDGPFDMPTLKVRVRYGSLLPTNPFPGLYVNNVNETAIEATGPIDDLQLWTESTLYDIESEMNHNQILPGGGIRYVPQVYDWVGLDEIELQLIGPKTKNNDILASAIVELDVHPDLEMKVNVILPPNGLQTNEDETFHLFKHDLERKAVVLIEGVARTKLISCSFMVSSGSFTPKRLYGTITEIKGSLSTVEYNPENNFNGNVNATISCFNSDDNQYDHAEFGINIDPVNDRPRISLRPDRVFETKEDQRLNLGATANLFIVDLDARESTSSRIAVGLNVTRGKALLHLPPPEFLGGIYVASETMSNLLFLGHIEDMNIALQYVTISFAPNWYGRASIAITCTDEVEFGTKPMEIFYHDWIGDHIDYIVHSVNDAPIITVKKHEVELFEGDEVNTFDHFVTIDDVDSDPSDVLNMTIEIEKVNGFFPGYFVSEVQTMQSFDEEKETFFTVIQKTLIEISFRLKSLRIVFMDDWYGFCHECVLVQVEDRHGGRVEERLSFTVHPINDAPLVNISTNLIKVREDEESLLSSVVNITVDDADELYSQAPRLITFEVKSKNMHTRIGFKSFIPGCHVIHGDPYMKPASALTIQGTTTIINEALRTMFYLPPPNFEDVDTLSFQIVDEHDFRDSDTLEIEVIAVNDPPKVVFKDIEKDQDLDGQPFFKTELDVTDPDFNETLSLSLTLQPPNQGSISCPYVIVSGVSIETSSAHYITLKGSLGSVQRAATEIIVSLNESTTEDSFLLTAIAVDNGGLISKDSKAIFSEMNAKVPKLKIVSDMLTILEDIPTNIASLINFNDEEDFKETDIFEIKFSCPSGEMQRRRGVKFSVPYFKFIDLALPGIQIPRYDIERGSLGSITFRGNAIALKNALQHLQFLPPLNFAGKLSILYSVRSLRQTIHSDVFTTQRIQIEIESVDDPPEILWQKSLFLDNDPIVELDEDAFQIFGGNISVRDEDIYDDIITLNLRIHYGSLCSSWDKKSDFNYHDFKYFDTDYNMEYSCFDKNITMSNSIDNVNKFIKTLAYKPQPNWWGMDNFTIEVQSNDITLSKSIRVAVRPQPDPTQINITSPKFVVEEDNVLSLRNAISLSDDDFRNTSSLFDQCVDYAWLCELSLTLHVTEGKLFAQGVGGALIIHLDKENEIVMRGLIADLNDSLKTLIYKPRPNFSGTDLLEIAIVSTEEESYSRTLQIQVSPMNDIPILSVPTALENSEFTVYEDSLGVIGDEYCKDGIESTIISCESVVINDIDSVHNATYKLSLYSENGFLKLPRLRLASDISASADFSIDNFANDIELEGTLDALNHVVIGIQFKGKPNYNSRNGFAKIHVLLEEEGSDIVSDFIKVKVVPVNDYPVIRIEGEISDLNVLAGDGMSYKRIQTPALVIDEDSPLHVRGISVRDVDCSEQSDLLELSLSSKNGLLLCAETEMLQLIIGDFEDFFSHIKFRGTVENINEALQHLIYKPNLDFHGDDVLRIHLSDMGNVGAIRNDMNFAQPGPLVDVANISITVLPVEDHPVLQAPTFLQLVEDSAAVLEIRLIYVESMKNVLQLFVQCNQGAIRFNHQNGLKFIDGSFNDSCYIALEGEVNVLQKALSQLLFTPPTNHNTIDSELDQIEITVQNNYVEGANKNISHTIYIEIDSVNDPPSWEVPVSFVQMSGQFSSEPIKILEDNILELGSISVKDVDANMDDSESLFFIKIIASNGGLDVGRYTQILSNKSTEKSIELSATFHFVNEALSSLVYKPDPNYHGGDSIDFFVTDGEFNSSITIQLQIIAESDVPIVEVPSVVVCTEEEWCSLRNIFINDPDLNPILSLEITAMDGLVAFAGGLIQPLKSVSILDGLHSGDDYFRLNGTASSLNEIVQKLAYLPNLGDAESMTTLTLTIKVPNELSMNQEMESTSRIYVAITDSQNNRPMIRYNKALYHDDPKCQSSFRSNSLPPITKLHSFCEKSTSYEPFQCVEDSSCILYGLSVYDPDSSLIELTLSVQNGELSLQQQRGILVYEGSEGKLLKLQGNFTNLNYALDTLSYLSEKNFVGKDYIKLKLLDPTMKNVNEFGHEMIIGVIVNGVEDTISIAGPEYVFHSQDEDSLSLIPSITILHEHNVPSMQFIYVQADVKVKHGKITFQKVEGLNFTIPSPQDESLRLWAHSKIVYKSDNGWANGSMKQDNGTSVISAMTQHWWKNVSICGLLENINDSLGTVSFTSDKDLNTETHDLAEVNVGVKRVKECFEEKNTDETQLNDGEVSIVIHVQPVNDAPVVTCGKLSEGRFQNVDYLEVDEDSNVSIPTHVKDVDNNILTVEITSSDNGLISVSNPNPGENYDLYFIQGAPDKHLSQIIMQGTIESLNGYLVNMVFKGEENHYGNDSIVVVKACDESHSCDSRSIVVEIKPIEDETLMYIPVDETLASPLIVLDEGDAMLIGSSWFQEEKMLLKRVSSSYEDDLPITDPYDLLPLEIQTAFVLKNGNERNVSFRSKRNQKKVCVRLTVDAGMISLKSGIHFEQSEDLVKSIEINTSIDKINKNVAKNLMYHSIIGETGHVNLNIMVTRDFHCNKIDDYCTCNFEVPDASANLKIFVVAINSPPVIHWISGEGPINATINTNTPLEGLQIRDEDLEDSNQIDSHQRIHGGFVTVTISVTKGGLSFVRLIGLTFIQGDGLYDRIIRITGSLDNINKALLTLTYRCVDQSSVEFEENGFCQPDEKIEFKVDVDDNGFTGKGGAKQDHLMVEIDIVTS